MDENECIEWLCRKMNRALRVGNPQLQPEAAHFSGQCKLIT